MTFAVRVVPLVSIRDLARVGLVRALRLADALERRWPALGAATRRAILSCWWNAAAAWRAWRNGPAPDVRPARLAELDRWKDVAPGDIALPRAIAPKVSIVVTAYGQMTLTLRCLASIQAHLPTVPIEVLVVDDAFPGPDVRALSAVRGIRLIRNDVNLGFLRSCNAAARIARGQFLLFLNNDTQVRPGWLDALLAIFADHPDAGIAGAKLIGADGRLQEAGGIVWNDASGWNAGRDQDPGAGPYNYRRETDYCSGACILLRRGVFLGVGGFDEQYAPAYCEDSDLSFRLRTIGLKTYYQPRSEVVHLEGATNGRDLRHGVKSRQIVNQAKLLRTWGQELRRGHFANGQQVLRAKDRAMGRQIILILDHMVPEPDRDAGSRTMLDIARTLVASGAVTKFWPVNLRRTPGYTEALQDLGVEVFHGPDQVPLPEWLKQHGAGLDLVLVTRPDVAELSVPLLRASTRARIAYYGHDLHFSRMRGHAAVTGDAALSRAAETMRAREIGIWRRCDRVIYPSAEEAAVVRDLAPGTSAHAIVPYALTGNPAAKPPPPANTILFVAGFGHPPNRDAAIWFVHLVLPLILARVPDARLTIAGSNPVPAVLALRGPAVSLAANLTDDELAALYAGARVAVVPLLAGAGVKRKTVEALWFGVPAVLTPVGAQGLPGVDAIVPVVSDADAFAAAVIDLLTGDAAWRRQAAAQRAYALARFNEDAFRQSLLRALDLTQPLSGTACPREAAVA